MVVLRCTQKLLIRLKRTAVSVGPEWTTRLGDWYGNILLIAVSSISSSSANTRDFGHNSDPRDEAARDALS
jgi:hypothetical protein